MDDARMRELLASQHAIPPLGLILRAVRGLLAEGSLVVGSALSQDPFDRLLLDTPSVRWMRYLPQTDDRATGLGLHAPGPGGTADPLVRLADIDADIELRQTHLSFDGSGSSHPVRRKLRRLDGLFGSRVSRRQRVDGIVVCEASGRTLAILRGSIGAWRADRPWVALQLDGGPDGSAIADMLEASDFIVFDQALSAHERAHAALPSVPRYSNWILAMPRESAFARLGAALFGRQAARTDGVQAWNTLLERQLHVEAGAGGVQFDASAAPRELHLPIDVEAPRWGFHEIEYLDDSLWSWIGPRPRAGIVLPPLAARLDGLSLRAISAIDLRNVAGLHATLDGARLRVRAHWKDKHGSFDLTPIVPSPRWRPFHCLELSMPVSAYPSGQGDRMLAMAINGLTLLAPAR